MSQNIFEEVFSNMNILDVEVGTIAEGMNIDGVDENSTVSEAMAVVISDTAREEFNYDISKENVEEILDDPQFREDIGNVSGDLIGGVITGNLDSDKLADDVEDLIENNKDTIEEVSGYEISDELIDEIHDKVSEIETEGGIMQENEYGYSMSFLYSTVANTIVYGCLGGGILCVIGIMLLNMFKLPTGFRTNGIAFLVNGVFTLIVGFVVRFAPKLLMGAIDIVLADNGVSSSTGVVSAIINNYVTSLAMHILIPGMIFLVLGIVCMITQGVLLTTSRNK
ncbi:MAG: hypothetical protein MJ130_04725 [Lachnospiraceae bacterium]|nr:hypothetical protein [Lachnospiraceae bacterium]